MPKKDTHLGKGLSAIFGDVKDIENEDRVETISIDLIVRNPYQPRIAFDEDSLDELAESIKEKGVIQPILVRQKGDVYELIVGERRLIAAKRAGLSVIPAIVRDVSDSESAELALVENLQRRDLNPIEEALAYKRLIKEFGYSQEELAKRVGKDRATVANTIRLLNLPDEIIEMLKKGEISPGHARAILSLKDTSSQVELARKVKKEKLSVRDTEREASLKKDEVELNAYLERLKKLCRDVKLKYRKGRGKIEIGFDSIEELNHILERMGL